MSVKISELKDVLSKLIDKEIEFGMVKRFDIKDIQTVHANNPHDASFPEALELAKQLGDQELPKEIIIIGINLREIPRDFSETLSPEIAKYVGDWPGPIHRWRRFLPVSFSSLHHLRILPSP